ncbi:MAG: ABC transporter substrate-binding protein [Sneathiella sp.]|nr:ABC transporter substrate-binding protein [Sneathiella sp.]
MGHMFPKIGVGEKSVPFKLPCFNRNNYDWWDITQQDRIYRIGLFIPLSGAAGIWGSSCIASAQVAVAEINAFYGINDQEVELVLVDAAMENESEFYQIAHDQIERQEIHAIVGMHLSAVLQKLVKIVAGRTGCSARL